MTLRHMKIFVKVYQYKSITKAAGELHLAQPSVSLAISELENYYGVQLFDRISRRIYETESGKMFYEYALHIVSLFDDMEKEIRNWDSLGVLRIGSSITIGNVLMPNVIREFNRLYPNVKVNLIIHNSAAIEQFVMDNQIDIAFIEGEVKQNKIIKIPFMQDRLCLICGNSDPLADRAEVSIKELEKCKFLMREQGSAGREIMESIFMLHHLNITPLWESVSTQAIVRGVGLGLGVSILPYFLVAQDIENHVIKEIKVGDADLSRNFSIIYHHNKYLSSSVKAFMEICMKYKDDTFIKT